ncbi:unnamed protein product [Caenorhabditis angaria]|uniref:Serpentine receptor class gamma n=1 Tax=Caenorhabditis angaria TaxID=860376 RepID=A0A9P1ISW2_9PELO|nr:unnamed protein product [Caenorhabditis angaria]
MEEEEDSSELLFVNTYSVPPAVTVYLIILIIIYVLIMRNRPEKAILYQTLVLVIVKILCFPCTIYAYGIYRMLDNPTIYAVLNVIHYPLFVIDVLATPIVFQVTYLFCNKTNLENLLKMNFRKLKTWRIICCGANKVEQRQEVYNSSTSAVQDS